MSPDSLHPELVAACRVDGGLVAAPVGLLELAGRHRVGALVLARLAEQGGLATLPAGQRPFVERRLRDLRRRAALAEIERERIAEALAEIEYVWLKGMALAPTVYREPWSREFRDLDLLVDRADLVRGVRALQRAGYRLVHDWRALLGYRRHHFHYQLQHPSGFVVEIHWDLVRPDSHFKLDPREILDAAVDGRPRAEHQLLSIVLQNLSEGFAHLARIVDVDRILRAAPSFDWALLARTAHEGKLSKPLALTLQLARRLLGSPLPAGFVAGLGVSALSRHQLVCFRPSEFLLDGVATRRTSAANLLRLWLLPTIGTRLRYVGELLTRRRLDPLVWVWKRDSPEVIVERDLGHRLEVLGKLTAYQLFLNLRRLVAGAERDFWEHPVDQEPRASSESPIAISSGGSSSRSSISAIEPNE